MVQSAFSLSFNGSDGYISANNVLLSSGAYTFAFWCKQSDITHFGGILDNRTGVGTHGAILYADKISGKAVFYAYTVDVQITGTTDVFDGQWHHFAGTVDGGGALRLYVDGVLEAGPTGSGDSASTGSTIHIGASNDLNNFSKALMDDVVVWGTVLSAAAILDMADGSSDVADNSPSSLWRMEEGTGTGPTADTSGTGYDGTFHGGVTWSSDTAAILGGSGFAAGVISATIASSTSIDLSTTAASGGASPYTYQFESSSDNSTWSPIGSDTGSTTYTDTGLTTRVLVYYRCTATDSDSDTAISNVVSITPGTPTTYYIANTGGDGSDGSNSTPWASVDKVNGWAQIPGDFYLFHGGDTFSETALMPSVSGTQAAPITFGSYGVGNATIASGANDVYGVLIQDVSFVTVENLNFVGPGYTGTPPAISTISTKAGAQIYSSQQGLNRLTTINLRNLDIGDYYNGVMVITRSARDVAGAPYYGNNGSVATGTVVGIDSVSITGCTIHDAIADGILFYGGYPDASGVGWPATETTFRDVYIADCEIYNIFGMPFETSGAPNVIAVVCTTGGMMERCVVHDCGSYANLGSSTSGVGGIVTGNTRNFVIQWCEIYKMSAGGSGVDGSAFDLDQDSRGCIVQHCFAHENDGPGFVAVHNSGHGTNQNNTFRYNISYNDSRNSTISYGGLEEYGGANNLWYNNTVYLNDGAVLGTAPAAVWLASATSSQFINNVFITTGNLVMVTGTVGSAKFIGNLYYPSGGTLNIAGQSSLADWQDTGQEQVGDLLFGVVADPLLLGEGSFGSSAFTPIMPADQVGTLTNFDLTGSSPAIGAGVYWSLLGIISGSYDFHGYPNRVTFAQPPDIGAVTYNGSSLVPGFGEGGGGGGSFIFFLNRNFNGGMQTFSGGMQR